MRHVRRTRVLALAATAAALSGCGQPTAYPPDLTFPAREDRLVLRLPTAPPASPGEPGKLDAELASLDALGGRTADPSAAPAEQRQVLSKFLADAFGTPAAPTVSVPGDDAVAVSAAKLGLTPDGLAEGGKLFRRHCLQCHGLAGDGRGPTGQWIYPHPRDYRRGAFKFVSTGDGGKPRAADLARTLRDGLPGTGMPAFNLLPDASRDLMANYVVYLSLRGQVEFQTLAALLDTDGEGGIDGDVNGFARERLKVILGQWEKSEAAPAGPTPPPEPDADAKQSPAHHESVSRGYELFVSKTAADCAACHEDFGRKAAYRYDLWGTVVRPADLTAGGGYKGGGRPEDLHHRIRGGIHSVGMPAHPTLTDAQVWDLVNFVRALPYPRELPPDVRTKVYPN